MASLLSRHLSKRTAPWPEVLIPVPLHPHRLQKRGYNQAAELALDLSKTLEISIDLKSYVRQKPTLAQSGLSKSEREHNLKNAFAIRKHSDVTHVAIVDDVMTTASTANGLAKLARSNGAQIIEVWCFARAR